jgi:hypothetical protein
VAPCSGWVAAGLLLGAETGLDWTGLVSLVRSSIHTFVPGLSLAIDGLHQYQAQRIAGGHVCCCRDCLVLSGCDDDTGIES